jgi:hypothetical protein
VDYSKQIRIKRKTFSKAIHYGGGEMSKHKKDPSTIGLNSPQVEGQGTTNRETGKMKADSSRRKQDKNL